VRGRGLRIVYPEGLEERALRAAALLRDQDLARPVLVGSLPAVAAITSGDRPCRNPASMPARRSAGSGQNGTAVATPSSGAQLSPTQNAVRATAGAPTSAIAATSMMRRRPDATWSRLPPRLSFGVRSGTLVVL